MADTGPFLTSCVIFYLSIGAAIFQILEESNWESARDKYTLEKKNILKKHQCLTKEDLDEILKQRKLVDIHVLNNTWWCTEVKWLLKPHIFEYLVKVVLEAAGQGVTITGENHRSTWDWSNSVIFASTIVTTIGFGNVAPKTKGGRVFCILYGLCGIPLCLVWISRLGSFFGDRAKRLSQVMIRKGVSVKKIQFTCTALFLLWGLLVHLMIPPVVFMYMEEWTYLEGLYYSFITLTTVGFGDYVAGVNPNIEYPRLYRIFAELWIYMGLAWLSLFFSWNVHMVVEAHKVFKKRRRHRHRYNEEPQPVEDKHKPDERPNVIDIFNFPEEEDYSTVIKMIGATAKTNKPADNINRSKSCSDIVGTNIETLDQSPRHRRMISISEVFINTKVDVNNGKQEEGRSLVQESKGGPEPSECGRKDNDENKERLDPETDGIIFTVPTKDATEEESNPDGGGSRFKISKVVEEVSLIDKDEKG